MVFSEHMPPRHLALHILASGSRGNAAIIEDVHAGSGVLIDCGISKKRFLSACDEVGFDPLKLQGILITHEHRDHTAGLGVMLRGLAKQGMMLPLYVSGPVATASEFVQEVQRQELVEIRDMRAEDRLTIGGMGVSVFRTSHDAAESFGFRFEAAGDAVGFATDTGVVTPQAHELLSDVHILGLESNHDPAMLKAGPYPAHTKARIASDAGHLSNEQSAAALESLLCDRLKEVVALHISQNNNDYRLPVRTLQNAIDRNAHTARVQAGFQNRPVSIR